MLVNTFKSSGEPKSLTLERLIMVGGVVAMSHATMMMILPSLPQFVGLLGGAAFAVGLVLGIASAARFMTNIPAGILSERIGRKPVVVIGALGVGTFASLSGTAPNIEVLLLYRFLTGLFSAMSITTASVVVTDLSTVENRGRSLGLMHSVQLIVGIAAPAGGGFVAEIFGPRVTFLASGVGAIVFGIWALARLPETRPLKGVASASASPAAPKPPSTKASAVTLLQNPNFQLAALLGFTQFFTRTGTGHSLILLFADDSLGMGPGQLGIWFSAASVLYSTVVFPAGYVADKFGRKAAIVPSGVALAVVLAVFPFADSTLAFGFVFIGVHLFSAFGNQAPVAYVGDLAPSNLRGFALGVWRTFGDLAGIVAPLIMTAFVQYVSFLAGFTFNALLVFVSVVLFARLAVETAPRKKHVQSEPVSASDTTRG